MNQLFMYSNFFVWTRAYNNKHYLVALASLMVVLSLAFQPLASALLVVKDTWWIEPGELFHTHQSHYESKPVSDL